MTTMPDTRRDHAVLIVAGLVSFFTILIAVYRPWDLADGFMIGAPLGRDFANLWLGGHLAFNGQFDLLIDLTGYNAAFQKAFAHNPAESFVFSYPPHSFLVLAPLGALPFKLAVSIWTLFNLACIAVATRLICREWNIIAAALFSPAVLTMVIFGHFGGMLALAAIFVLLRGKTQPVLAGICLALTSMKPQFAVVLGVVLLCSGYWRTLFWSIPAGILLLSASLAVFGLKPWTDFITWTIPFHARLIGDFHIEAMPTIVSVYAAAGMLGAPAWLAQAIQYAFSALVLWRAIVGLRRGGPTAETLTLVLLAALMALPYINSYDLAIVAPALTPALLGRPPGRPFLPLSPALILWVVPVFALPFGLLGLPIAPLCVAGVLGLALLRAERAKGAGFLSAATGPTAA